MNGEVEKKLRKLSPKQAQILSRIINSVDGMGELGYQAQGLGGILSALYRNGLIQPLGKINRRARWEITDGLQKEVGNSKKEVIQLLRRISTA